MLVAAVALAGCRGGGKQHREGSAAPVEVVNQPVDGRGAAPTNDEIEPNDSDDTATPLALGTTMRGRIDPDSDADHYRIDVAQAGALAVTLSGVEGVDLILEIEDASGNVVAKSDRGAARVREGVPNLGVTPGRYTAVVKKKLKPPPKGSKAAAKKEEATGGAPVYEISAAISPFAGNAEREPDDDRGTGNDLIIGDTASGFIGWAGDADVWKLSTEALSAKNAFDVEISPVEGVALSLEIADGVGGVLASRKAPRGAGLVVRGMMPVVNPGAPPFHYLTVRGDKSNPETAYRLKVTAHVVAPDAEIEPNDTPEKAMPFPADRTVVHATWTPGDVDCFALAPSDAARSLEITVDTPADVDLSLELLADGKSIVKADHPAKGAAERVTAQIPAGVHAVIRVKGSESSTAEGAYDVVVKEAGGP